MHHPALKASALACAVLFASQTLQAELYRYDTGPYLNEFGGFPAWYQDTHGRALELCRSLAVSSRAGAGDPEANNMCALASDPGLYDISQPLSFPDNFPHEMFWFTADAFIEDPASGVELIWIAALEAAFANEEPAEGDQVSFGRIRIRVDLPFPGVYTITHPYGVDVFDVTEEDIGDDGRRAINMTRDIGIGAAGDFSGAMGSDVGPFLRSVNGPYQETNPDTGELESFIGDPNLEEAVTGSPFNTNYVRIEGPSGIDLRTELFVLTGKLSTVELPTPVVAERATFSRQAGPNGVEQRSDVFALAPPPPAQVNFSAGGQAATSMSEADATGRWYGQSDASLAPHTTIEIHADNSLAIPSSTADSTSIGLVDQVIIQRAEYNLSNAQLTVEAYTSDETGGPQLTLRDGHGNLIGQLSGGGPIKSLSTSITPIPPASIRVESAHGGVDIEEVVLLP